MPSRSPDDKSRMDAPTRPKLSCERTVTLEPEEFDALMAELPPPESEPQSFTKITEPSEINEKFRKIEFYMMIIVGLVLLVLILCKAN